MNLSKTEFFIIPLIRDICSAFEKENINYCHWKSNYAINLSLNGTNDLDLLVSHNDKQAFISILSNFGFKLALNDPEYQFPGIMDFYGYDNIADKWIHIHAHYRLILGHDATKNYHLVYRETISGISCSSGVI